MPTDDDVTLTINNSDLKNGTEVVYKPTTMSDESRWKQSFHSLRPETEQVLTDSAFLYRTAFVANLLAFVAGCGFSWTSPVFSKLETQNPLNAPVDASQQSIIASILCVGAAMSPVVFGYLADKVGRKKTLLLTALPMVAGTVMLAFGTNVEVYYGARLLYGVGSGGVFTVLTMYTGEITADHNRGKFNCFVGIFVNTGILYPFSLGGLLSIRLFTLSILIPLLAFIIGFSLLAPESPIYSLKKGDSGAALRALMQLRDISADVARKEIEDMAQVLQSQQRVKGGVTVLFRNRGTRKGFMIASGLLILQQFSGINAIIGFMSEIFKRAGSAVQPQVATSIIGVIQVITIVVTSSLVDKLGRKCLLLTSAIGSGASIILLGTFFYLQKRNPTTVNCFWWMPIICLLFYIVSYGLGLNAIPWTVLSEVFPDNVKSSASALASSACFSFSFVVTLAFPIISEMLGYAQSFWLFGVCCIIGVVFIWVVVPETKGKSVQEIQEILSQ